MLMRRTERGFCQMTRGLEGLFPYACAASWARILPDDARFDGACFRLPAPQRAWSCRGAVWKDCFRLPARRTECGFCRMTRGLAGLFSSACAASWVRILLGRVWMELVSVCLRFSECGLEGLFLYVCASASADFAGRDWVELVSVCLRLSECDFAGTRLGRTVSVCLRFCECDFAGMRLGRTVSVCLRFCERGFCGARLDGACLRLPALQRARILRGAAGWSLLPSACAAH